MKEITKMFTKSTKRSKSNSSNKSEVPITIDGQPMTTTTTTKKNSTDFVKDEARSSHRKSGVLDITSNESSQLPVGANTSIANSGNSSARLPPLPSNLRKASQLSAEVEQGNREYKYKLTNLTKDQLRHRISQLAWRLNESLEDDSEQTNNGTLSHSNSLQNISSTGTQTAVYQIGVDDDGTPVGLTKSELEESLRNLSYMAEIVGCSLTVSNVMRGIGRQGGGLGRSLGPDNEGYNEDEERLTMEVVFRKIERQMIGAMHLQIAVAGDMNAGKSTLIGVLLSGKYDNGKGLARTHVFRHNHEVQTGTTSSVSDHTIFFGVDGKILNHSSEQSPGPRLRSRSDLECADEACRVASFIDLAGHVKYLKTTLLGISSRSPALCLLCVSANSSDGLATSMMLEHLGMAIALSLQLAIVINKVDTVSSPASTTSNHTSSTQSSALANVIALLQRILVLQGKQGVVVTSVQQIIEQVHPSLASCPPTPPELSSSVVNINPDSELSSTRSSEPITSTSSVSSTIPSKVITGKSSVIVPLFLISCVTGEGLDLIQSYIFQIPLPSISTSIPSSVFNSATTQGSVDSERDTLIDQQQYHTEVRIVGSFPKVLASYSSEANLPQYANSIDNSGMVSANSAPDLRELSDVRSNHGSNSNSNSNRNRNSNNHGNMTTDSNVTTPPKRSINHSSDIAIIDGLIHSDVVFLIVIQRGVLSVDDILYVGPSSKSLGKDNNNNTIRFERVRISSIRVNDIAVRSVRKGQCATIRVKLVLPLLADFFSSRHDKVTTSVAATESSEEAEENIGQYHPRRSPVGLIMLSCYEQSFPNNSMIDSMDISTTTSLGPILPIPKAVWEFTARIAIVNHPSKVRVAYESVLHVDNVRQTARIVSISAPVYAKNRPRTSSSPSKGIASTEPLVATDSNSIPLASTEESEVELGTGDRALCRFRFLFRPEYLHIGSPLLLRDGRIRGIGNIVDIVET